VAVNLLDWTVIGVFLVLLIGMSVLVGRGQTGQDDYYVGGRDLPWWAVGISTMATQTSAVSFISIPAFVALKPEGGLTWIQYELAVPLAMIATSIALLPLFRKLELISVYEYLELRFGPSMRTLISAIFLLSRAFGTAVGLYASAIVLAVAMQWPIWATILLMGAFTVVYDVIGGMKAVVYSDVVQSLILFVGIFVCIWFAAKDLGGIQATLDLIPAERLNTLDLSLGLGDGSHAPLWGFLIGAFFLYVSYYGTDQSQVQRELSARDIRDTRRSLFLNGYVRFPLASLYLALGIALGAFYNTSADFQDQVPADLMDYLVPVFVLQYLPEGIRGLLVAALLAASMSSLDSALNSLSAATMRDFVEKRWRLGERASLWYGRLTTLAWGVFITAFAYAVGGIADTVIEAINKVGSAVYGPILAAFTMGVLSKRAGTAAVFAGVVAGVGLNLALWVAAPGVFWMWWNFFGWAAAVAVTWVGGWILPHRPEAEVAPYTLRGSGLFREIPLWSRGETAMLIYFFIILGVVIVVDLTLGASSP
jgi:SSS family solute:Na+ symporter